MSESVLVGMSGGVDSSVAAYILKEKGYNVTGLTLSMFDDSDFGIKSDISVAKKDAKEVCDILGIKHISLDLKSEFKKKVVDYFCNEYLSVRTPNPCIACNKNIKWSTILSECDRLGISYIATGHYSNIISVNERLSIEVPKDITKDQTYVLYTLSQEELKRTLFTLSGMSKDEVRKIAEKIGLPVSKKKDSQDICFIPDGDYKRFLCNNADISGFPKGRFIDTNGADLGEHQGLYNYTVGQRKNLGIALGERMYVKCLNRQDNTVVLARDKELYTDELLATDIYYMGDECFDPKREYTGRIRYSHRGTPCHVVLDNGRLFVKFKEPVRAVTPGQALVLYYDNYVAGGATII